MKKLLLSTIAFSALSLPALAADLPARTEAAPAPAIAPVAYSWSGAYIGATAGYARSTNRADYGYTAPAGAIGTFVESAVTNGFLPTRLGDDGNGKFTGGLTAGYNFQSGSFVYGVEADVFTLGQKSSSFEAISPEGAVQVRPGPGSTTQDDTLTATSVTKGSANWLGTLRARAGLSFDRLLVFGTGGLAFGGVKSSTALGVNFHCVRDCLDPNTDANALWSGSTSETRFGWALGAGVEYGITQNVSMKAEYLHYDLGKKTYALTADTATATQLPGTSGAVRAKISGDVFRAGVNYRF